jgi:cyclophilin family peptidyl-prolyl cis-trans isomerase
VFDDKPLTQANFMEYVNGGRYDGSIMHRLSKGFVIQGGGFYEEFVEEPAPVNVSLDPTAIVDRDGNLATPNPSIVTEYAVGVTRSNLVGTIAMARVGGQPNSATNQWFVNYKNNSFLDDIDGGFTVFARVLGDGMALYNAFNTLSIANLNPDTNNDGVRDGGPFFINSTDGVPYLSGGSGDLLVELEKAKRIDYLGAGLTTTVPAGGLTFSTRDVFIEKETAFVFEGVGGLTVGAGRTLGIREQTNIAHPLVNQGTLAPGLSLGMIRLQSFRQDPGATLEIQLGGTATEQFGQALPAPIQGQPFAHLPYDRLEVTNVAFLGGELDVTLLNGFAPAIGNTFTIISAGLISDTFDSINLPQLSAGRVWNVTQTNTAFTLTVNTGDYNRDGVVDAGDYVVWRKMYNPSVAVTAYSGADGSGDGFVNDADYLIWQRNLGNIRGSSSGGGGSSSVPEPSSVALLLGAALIIGRCHRKQI